MAEKTKTFVYHGPPVFVVALQREVSDGDEVEGPAALEASAGFEVKKPSSSSSSKKD